MKVITVMAVLYFATGAAAGIGALRQKLIPNERALALSVVSVLGAVCSIMLAVTGRIVFFWFLLALFAAFSVITYGNSRYLAARPHYLHHIIRMLVEIMLLVAMYGTILR